MQFRLIIFINAVSWPRSHSVARRWFGGAPALMRRFADTETADEGGKTPGSGEPGQRDPTRFVQGLSSRAVRVIRWVVLELDASASLYTKLARMKGDARREKGRPLRAGHWRTDSEFDAVCTPQGEMSSQNDRSWACERSSSNRRRRSLINKGTLVAQWHPCGRPPRRGGGAARPGSRSC